MNQSVEKLTANKRHDSKQNVSSNELLSLKLHSDHIRKRFSASFKCVVKDYGPETVLLNIWRRTQVELVVIFLRGATFKPLHVSAFFI